MTDIFRLQVRRDCRTELGESRGFPTSEFLGVLYFDTELPFQPEAGLKVLVEDRIIELEQMAWEVDEDRFVGFGPDLYFENLTELKRLARDYHSGEWVFDGPADHEEFWFWSARAAPNDSDPPQTLLALDLLTPFEWQAHQEEGARTQVDDIEFHLWRTDDGGWSFRIVDSSTDDKLRPPGTASYSGPIEAFEDAFDEAMAQDWLG